MTANLWVLGNSFSEQSWDEPQTWMKQVAENLNLTLHNLSLGGASLSYTYKTFNDVRSLIKSNDVLIITLTDIDRRWLLKDEPDDAIWTLVDRRKWYFKDIDPKLEDAITYYLTYLDQQNIHNVYLENFLYNLDNFVKKTNVHVIVIPTFEGVFNLINEYRSQFDRFVITDKPLMSVSQEEFQHREFAKSGIMRFIFDLRLNHLVASNHKILADKITNNVKNKEPITFRNGFLNDFLNCSILQSEEYSKLELYNIHNSDDRYEYCIDYIKNKCQGS